MKLENNYLVTIARNEDDAEEIEFNFESVRQATEFIDTALLHNANIKVSILYFPKAKSEE